MADLIVLGGYVALKNSIDGTGLMLCFQILFLVGRMQPKR